MAKIEASEVPTVIVNEDGARYAIQLVDDDLPGGVDLLVQVRAGTGRDMTFSALAIRGAALLGYLETNPDDFDRVHPASPPNPNRIRPRVLSGHLVIESPEAQLERSRADAEERRREEQARREEYQRREADRERRAKLDRHEREAEDLRAQLDAERAEREALAAKLASLEAQGEPASGASTSTASSPAGGDEADEPEVTVELEAPAEGAADTAGHEGPRRRAARQR